MSALRGKPEVGIGQLDFCFCEGFRMPAPWRWRRAHRGRRPPTSKGGNRWGAGRWRGAGYGDLSAAVEVCDWSRGDPANWPTVKRLMHERWIGSNAVKCRTI